MEGRSSRSGGYQPERRTGVPAVIESIQLQLKDYRERKVTEMIGPTLGALADAYERQAQITQDTEDLVWEILYRIEAADCLSEDESRRYVAWRQRCHVLSDLFSDQLQLELVNHPKLKQVDISGIKRLMCEFELGAANAKTPFGTRRYTEKQLRDIALVNQRLGIQ